MISRAIYNAFKKKKERDWETLYWLIDVHDTIIKSTYDINLKKVETYPFALQTLKEICLRDDSKLILWTSSYSEYVESFRKWIENYGINFSYFNENPECKSTPTGDFSTKFYFSIIVDDKAGFNPEKDWKIIYDTLKELDDGYKF